MKIERLEVRLRPGIDAEKELIHALEENSRAYGKKSEFMRECLRRGYSALRKEAKGLIDEGSDEITILDALAKAFTVSDYRVMKTYLDSCADLNEKYSSESGKVISKKETETSIKDAARELQNVVSRAAHSEEESPPLRNNDASTETKDNDISSERVPVRPDWTRMRGLAGSGGGGGTK